MEKKNEFKFSALRQFGSENISFTATIHSDKQFLSEEEVEAQVKLIDSVIRKQFILTQEREISEKSLLVAASERRTAEVKKLEEALKSEMDEKSKAGQTLKDAERLDKKLKK